MSRSTRYNEIMARKKEEFCDYCPGTLERRFIDFVDERDRKFLVVEEVPTDVCRQCHMRYYDARVVDNLDRILDRRGPFRRVLRVPVVKYESDRRP